MDNEMKIEFIKAVLDAREIEYTTEDADEILNQIREAILAGHPTYVAAIKGFTTSGGYTSAEAIAAAEHLALFDYMAEVFDGLV
jgi:hypothetical protein